VSKSKPLPNTIFYLDECLGGNKVPAALKEAGIVFELHNDHFPRGTADEEWLPEIGKKGWVLLTQDKGIKRRKNELAALRENKVRAFVISARGLRGEEIGALIVKTMPQILRVLKHTEAPLIAAISKDKIVELREGHRKYK
jgi:predicted nuclease of predicted toxin-antitoxin system